ncbi:MAG: ATP-binding protein [Armatimonadota bacterium]
MKELSLHILDLIENSVAGGASRVDVVIDEDHTADRLSLTVRDDGRGMSPEIAAHATDAFTTTRTTRKVGLGIPLLAAAAEQAGGRFSLTSSEGRGTVVVAEFRLSHIDRAPLGKIDETIATAALLHPELDLRLRHRVGRRYYSVRTCPSDARHPATRAALAARAKVRAGRARINSTA